MDSGLTHLGDGMDPNVYGFVRAEMSTGDERFPFLFEFRVFLFFSFTHTGLKMKPPARYLAGSLTEQVFFWERWDFLLTWRVRRQRVTCWPSDWAADRHLWIPLYSFLGFLDVRGRFGISEQRSNLVIQRTRMDGRMDASPAVSLRNARGEYGP